MSERDKQIEFLKAMAGRQQSRECEAIRERIHRAERDERYLRRIIFLVLVLMFFSIASLCYATVFWPEFPRERSQLLIRLSCCFGLASLICLLCFIGYWIWHRWLLNELYNECRQLVMTTLRSHRGSD